MSPDIRLHPKIIVSTSPKIFSNSIKIAAIRTVLNMFSLTNITKILKQSLKTQKKHPPQLHNKLAFNIFLVVPNFDKISTTVKIVKKPRQAKKVLSLKV